MTIATAAPTVGQVAGEKPRLTPEQLARLPEDGQLYELVDGQLVEKKMSDLAQFIANALNVRLVLWAARGNMGAPLVEATFQCFPFAADLVRRPDVSFISRERLAGYSLGHPHFTIAPDLAVEVVSPHDEVYELDRKIDEYFRVGVRRVWVINPERQSVRIHRAPGDLSELIGAAELADDLVLPGFRCPLAELFAGPAAVSA